MIYSIWIEYKHLHDEYPLISLTVIFLIGHFAYYRRLVVKPVQLHSKPSSRLAQELKSSLTILQEEYWPTFWCYEGRFQTIFAPIIRSVFKDIKYTREVLKLPDGGEVALDWIHSDYSGDEGPICLFLPGMAGCSQSDYIKSLVNVARYRLRGIKCVVFNNRGQGGLSLKTPKTYCVTDTEDLQNVINHIKHCFPQSQLMAVGISFGGILLGNYLSEQNDHAQAKLVAAMLISAAFDPFKGNVSMETPGLNCFINRLITQCLIHLVKRNTNHFGHLPNLEQVYASKTIREFDARFTSPLFGFPSHHEYCTKGQLKGRIHQIKVPTLALNAEDDLFTPEGSLPLEEALQSESFAFITTKYGGHQAFMEGILPSQYGFSDRVFEQYAKAVFSKQNCVFLSQQPQ